MDFLSAWKLAIPGQGLKNSMGGRRTKSLFPRGKDVYDERSIVATLCNGKLDMGSVMYDLHILANWEVMVDEWGNPVNERDEYITIVLPEEEDLPF